VALVEKDYDLEFVEGYEFGLEELAELVEEVNDSSFVVEDLLFVIVYVQV
jgi:hypothetical protein